VRRTTGTIAAVVLTAPMVIAGASDGTVHRVEDVAMKAQASSKAGASAFIVPRAQVVDAKRTSKGMRVIGVRSLDEALVALGAAGCGKR
jgi:PDZ domain-containing protein